MHQAEALLVAAGPLKVVHQAPVKEAAHIHTRLHGLVQRLQVGLHIGLAAGVAHAAVHHLVGFGIAVFRDVDGREGVVAVDALQQVREALGVVLPAHVGHAVPVGRGHRWGAGAGPDAGVVIDAQKVQRLGNDVEITGLNVVGLRQLRALGVGLVEDRVHVPAHKAVVLALGAGLVGGAVGGGGGGRLVEHNAQRRFHAGRAHGLQRQPVREQQMVRHTQHGRHVFLAGGKHALVVAQGGGAPGFVVGGDAGHAVAQQAAHALGVVGKAVGGVAGFPALLQILQALGQVPVVQRGVGGNAALQQAVHQAFVKVQPLGVPGAVAQRLHAGPGDREAVAVHAQALDHVEIRLQAVVVVAGHIAGVAIHHLAGGFGEGVPNGRTAAPLGGRAFNLVGAGGHAPAEVGGERGQGECLGSGHRVSLRYSHLKSFSSANFTGDIASVNPAPRATMGFPHSGCRHDHLFLRRPARRTLPSQGSGPFPRAGRALVHPDAGRPGRRCHQGRAPSGR